MRQVYFATTNKGKVVSLQSGLARYGIEVVHADIALPEPRTDDIRKIAQAKVLAAYEKIRRPVIAQDSGFYLHTWDGFPGAFVNLALETLGVRGILKLMRNEDNRECHFGNCLAYYDGTQQDPILFESDIEGFIADSPRGELYDFSWSPLHLIFIPKGEVKTLGEFTKEEYETLHKKIHRNSYLARFAEWFLSQE